MAKKNLTEEDKLSGQESTTSHSPEGDQAHQDARTADNESDGGHSHLGNPSNPQAAQQPTSDTGFDTAAPTAAEAGSETHLNAYAQEVEDQRAKVINAVNEAFDKAKDAIGVAQARSQE